MIVFALLLIAMMVMIVIVDYSKFHRIFIAPFYGFIAPIVVTTLSTFSLRGHNRIYWSTGSSAILFYPMKVFLCVSQFVNCHIKTNANGCHFHR